MAAAQLNLISAVRFYIDKIVSDGAIGGMKALLLDSVTTKIVSMVYSQSQILEQEVYLVEQLGKKSHEPMNHLKAAVFVEPTEANIDVLIRELKEPKFSEYHIFFSNVVSQDALGRLGRADEHEVVRQVQEYFADYLPINDDFFHLGADKSIALSSSLARTLESGQIFDRNVTGVLSLLLSLKRKPSAIRYQATSDLARRIATDINTQIERDEIFDFRRQQEGPLLLILDRRDDPITPLLTQWTYQAMVHELLGINNNRVSLKKSPGVKKDMEEVVLSCTQDDFFERHKNANFGDLGVSVKQMLDEYQKSAKMNENITSIEQMQAFVERYPAFRARSINVTKHVGVLSELSRLTDVCHLLDISQLEQEMACTNDHSAHKQQLLETISNRKIQPADKLRLSLIFLIRYESYNESRELKAKLTENGLSSEQLSLVDGFLDYAGEQRRAPGLFSAGATGIFSSVVKSLSSSVIGGAQNVYTQHQPVLFYTLEAIAKGKLKDSSFPAVGNSTSASSRPGEVLVYIAGGATYEEACKVSEFNAANPSMRVILGGSCVHNSNTFLFEISRSFST